MGITDRLGANKGVFDKSGDDVKEATMAVFKELVGEKGSIVASSDLSSWMAEDANFGCDAMISVDSSKELVGGAKEITGDEGVNKVTDDRETEGDLEFHARCCAGRVGLISLDMEDGTVEAGFPTCGVVKGVGGSSDVEVHTGAIIFLESGVREVENHGFGEVNDARVVVVQTNEAILHLIEFGQARRKPRAENWDFGGVFAVTIEDRCVSLIKKTAFQIGRVVNGDTGFGGDG